jgi:hypothetical protein
MEKLTIDQMGNLVGGVSRTEYCYTLWQMWTSGGYQGSVIQWSAAWQPNCGDYGYDFSIQ